MNTEGIPIAVAGALSGCVYVQSLDSSVGELRREVCRLLRVDQDSTSLVKLIAGGKVLQDDSKSLQQCGVTSRSRILVSNGAARSDMQHADERQHRLERLKAVADKMASRSGRGTTDAVEFSLENQAGTKLELGPQERKAIVTGLALHEKGKRTLAKGRYSEALEELLLAEEAFNMCNPALLQGVDNFAMLLLDIVWCCFKLGDIRQLSVCKDRLAQARSGLRAAHGPGLERLRVLHGNFRPEMSVYVRLELLEGVLAYHMHDTGAATAHLQQARGQWKSMQVSEESLLALCDMGYSHVKATRALRFTSGDVEAAVTFLIQDRAKEQERRKQRKRLRVHNQERPRYGRTSTGEYVDMEMLDKLCRLGYGRAVCAEALRQCDNDEQRALDLLTDLGQAAALKLAVVLQEGRQKAQGQPEADVALTVQLVSLGWKETYAKAALSEAYNSLPVAQATLERWGNVALQDFDLMAGLSRPAAGPPGTSGGAGSAPSTEGAGPSGAANGQGPSHSHTAQTAAAAAPDPGAVSDQEMEDDLSGAIESDPMAAYDVDVTQEGEVIQLYLAMLESGGNSNATTDAHNGTS